MRATDATIPPLDPASFTGEQRELAGDWTDMNFVRVMVRSPALFRVLFPFISKLIVDTALPPRDRQILVLRTLARGNDVYELTHHRRISTNAGMTDDEIASACAGSGPGIAGFDDVLIAAADELFDEHVITETTFTRLAERYSQVQLLEVVSLCGLYSLMNMLTKTCDIPLESDHEFELMGVRRDYV